MISQQRDSDTHGAGSTDALRQVFGQGALDDSHALGRRAGLDGDDERGGAENEPRAGRALTATGTRGGARAQAL